MKYRILILSVIFSSCSTPDECPQLNYNSINKLTILSDGLPYTGRCTLYVDGYKNSIQQYLNGVDYGTWIFYYPNGNIETKGKFRDGMKVGKWKYYYESGSIKQKSNYSRLGKRKGKWIEYDEDGKESLINTYE
jgi:antitoxin component YwqK of YwqJK toxin-antitoxin module